MLLPKTMSNARLRPLCLTGASVIAFALSVSIAQAEWQPVTPPSGQQSFVPIIDHYAGVTVWNQIDGPGTYSLYGSANGVAARLPIASRGTPFDVDLGPSKDGQVTAVYSRCKREGDRRLSSVPLDAIFAARPYPLWTAGRGCDLYRYDFATGQETKIAGASTDQASEMLPSIWRGRIAFARVYDRRRGERGTVPTCTPARSGRDDRPGSRGAAAAPSAYLARRAWTSTAGA